MKKTITLLLAALLAAGTAIGAAAFEADVPESAGEVGETAASASLSAIPIEGTQLTLADVPAEYIDPSLGTLVYFNDFEGYPAGSYSQGNQFDGGSAWYGYIGAPLAGTVSAIFPTSCTSFDIKADANDNQYIELTQSTSQWPQILFSLNLNANGSYCIACDVKMEADANTYPAVAAWAQNANNKQAKSNLCTFNTQGFWANNCISGYFNLNTAAANTTTNPLNTIRCFYILNPNDGARSGEKWAVDNIRIYYQKPGVDVTFDTNAPGGTGVYNLKTNGAGTGGCTNSAFSSGTINLFPGDYLPEVYTYGYSFLGWFDADGKQVKTVPETSGTTLTAKWVEYKPGLNILTGTPDVADFEDGTGRQYFKLSSGRANVIKGDDITKISFTQDETTKDLLTFNYNTPDETLPVSGNVLRYFASGCYLHNNLPIGFKNDGRKYKLTFKAFSKINMPAPSYWRIIYNFNNDGSTSTGFNLDYSKWNGNTITLTDNANATNAINVYYHLGPDDRNSMSKIGTKEYGTGVGFFYNYMRNEVFYDDVAVYPYYKITYRDDEGNVLSADQGIDVYTPKSDNYFTEKFEDGKFYKQTGWSRTQGAAYAPAAIVLDFNEDFDLYPVWTEVSAFKTDAMSGKTGTSCVTESRVPFTAGEVVDDGKTEATVSINVASQTVTVTAAGYAGEVTVKLTTADGDVYGKMRLYSGEKFRPGRNFVTGTEEPFGFESDISWTTLSTVALNTGNWSLIGNPLPVGNTSANVARVGGQFNYLCPKADFSPAIEPDRPLAFTADYNTNTSYYVVVNGSSGGNNVYTTPGSTGNAWTTRTVKLVGKNHTALSGSADTRTTGIYWLGIGGVTGTYTPYLNKTHIYLDNISYTPYYKITYVGIDGTETVKYELPEDGIYSVDPTIAADASGYKLASDGETFAIDEDITLDYEDITIYLVSEPVSEPSNLSFRLAAGDKPSGIRVTALVTDDQHSTADEYGFIVTRKVILDAIGADDVTFDLAYSGADASKTAYVTGVNFNRTQGIDLIYDTLDNGDVRFSGVVTGIQNTMLDDIVLMRPYIKYGTSVFYGTTVSACLADFEG